MTSHCFADRLGEYLSLTVPERIALQRLGERERTLRRGTVLFRENHTAHELFILRSGLMMSYVILENGSRQIVRFIFPGDMIALSALAYPRNGNSIGAIRYDCLLVRPFVDGADRDGSAAPVRGDRRA